MTTTIIDIQTHYLLDAGSPEGKSHGHMLAVKHGPGNTREVSAFDN